MTDILALAAHVQERATAAAIMAAAETVRSYMLARGRTSIAMDDAAMAVTIAALPLSASRPFKGGRVVTIHRLNKILGY